MVIRHQILIRYKESGTVSEANVAGVGCQQRADDHHAVAGIVGGDRNHRQGQT